MDYSSNRPAQHPTVCTASNCSVSTDDEVDGEGKAWGNEELVAQGEALEVQGAPAVQGSGGNLVQQTKEPQSLT